MAEPSERVELKTAFGSVVAHGPVVFIVLALLALIAVVVWEENKRKIEHEEIDCQVSLDIYLQTLKHDTTLTWHDVPSEYWRCLPRAVIDRPKTN